MHYFFVNSKNCFVTKICDMRIYCTKYDIVYIVHTYDSVCIYHVNMNKNKNLYF